MKLVICISRQSDTNYRAWCPALPGCMVYGQSRREAHERVHAAIEGYLASLDIALPRELQRQFQAVAS